MTILYVLLILFGAEFLIDHTVRRQRAHFQWLITEEDELPELDREGLEKFFDGSYDPELGWARKPNTTGTDKGREGKVTYHIDERGSRRSPVDAPPVVSSFGDSYVFCRQVEDGETWQAQFAGMTGIGMQNFGVGNYGADQGLLRYERTELPGGVEAVILGFVPETICRVHSYWKHYLEFGNTFAFKPRFTLDSEGELELLENPMRTPDHFDRLAEIVPRVSENDRFYERKFRSLQFRRPYLLSYLRHPVRNTRLMGALLTRSLMRALGRSGRRTEDRPFRLIMEYNIRESHRFYQKPEFTRLLTEIIRRFREEAERRGHRPLLLVMPQMMDLELSRGERTPYEPYYERLSRELDLEVVDMTPRFRGEDLRTLYIEDYYGGHLSAEGNRRVAEALRDRLENLNVLKGNEEGGDG